MSQVGSQLLGNAIAIYSFRGGLDLLRFYRSEPETGRFAQQPANLHLDENFNPDLGILALLLGEYRQVRKGGPRPMA